MKTWQLLKNNPALFQRYFVKEFLIQSIREFFLERNYHELESPILTNALPQERYLNALSTEIKTGKKTVTAYITPTTETYNKKILAAGLGDHFVITKVARGMEEIGENHLPEFSMLEWYHTNGRYIDLMDDLVELLHYITKNISLKLEKEKSIGRFSIDDSLILRLRNGILLNKKDEININQPFEKYSINSLLQKFAGFQLEEIQDIFTFREKCRELDIKIGEDESWQICFEMLFAQIIEPELPKDKPYFLYDYPKQVCVLTAESETNPLVCERLEFFIAGKELANGYTELLDYVLQKANFDKEEKAREAMKLEKINYDYDLIEAIKSGISPVAGIGMGLDRLAMLLAGANTISEINYFPATDWD